MIPAQVGMVMANLRYTDCEKHWDQYLDMREDPPMEAQMGCSG